MPDSAEVTNSVPSPAAATRASPTSSACREMETRSDAACRCGGSDVRPPESRSLGPTPAPNPRPAHPSPAAGQRRRSGAVRSPRPGLDWDRTSRVFLPRSGSRGGLKRCGGLHAIGPETVGDLMAHPGRLFGFVALKLGAIQQRENPVAPVHDGFAAVATIQQSADDRVRPAQQEPRAPLPFRVAQQRFVRGLEFPGTAQPQVGGTQQVIRGFLREDLLEAAASTRRLTSCAISGPSASDRTIKAANPTT